MIDDATYADYRQRIDTWNRAVAGHLTAGAPPPDLDALGVTNEMRDAVEVYELHRDKPSKFLAYTAGDDGRRLLGPHVTTWMGTHVGKVLPGVKHWRDRHGNRRYSIRVLADWGGEYAGQTLGPGMSTSLRRVRL